MADAIPTPYENNSLIGTYYDFPKKEDILGGHYHSQGQGHITIVQSGCVAIKSLYLENNWEKIGKSGDVFNLPDEQWHEIIALEDNSKILNIQKG
jgi:quercetin dioxygenase-like cupin family protein